MNHVLATINLVVYNGEKYIRHCLDSIKSQTYSNIEVNIWDNASTDNTREIIKSQFPDFHLIESPKNLGTWVGQEEALKYSRGEYIVAISVDIILDPRFVEKIVEVFQSDKMIGVVQGKVYKYEFDEAGKPVLQKSVIDTCGFEIFRSRRVVNIGHGERDLGQFGEIKEIFAAEGAVPVFLRRAMLDAKVGDRIIDPDFFWYGDDLDLCWRLHVFGWKQIFAPQAIAYHDRQTTKVLSKDRGDFIRIRRNVPMFKRRLDWRNTILAIIKNDFAINFFKDIFYIAKRQFQLLAYFFVFEPRVLLEVVNIVRLLPRMLKRRRLVMKNAIIKPSEIERWFL